MDFKRVERLTDILDEMGYSYRVSLSHGGATTDPDLAYSVRVY